jgi:hypothetical protein
MYRPGTSMQAKNLDKSSAEHNCLRYCNVFLVFLSKQTKFSVALLYVKAVPGYLQTRFYLLFWLRTDTAPFFAICS